MEADDGLKAAVMDAVQRDNVPAVLQMVDEGRNTSALVVAWETAVDLLRLNVLVALWAFAGEQAYVDALVHIIRTADRVFLQEMLGRLREALIAPYLEKPLAIACEVGRFDMAEDLLDAGARANEAIEHAIHLQDQRALSWLTRVKAQIVKRYLWHAIRYDKPERVALLLDSGMNPATGMDTAIRYRRVNIAIMLLEAGAFFGAYVLSLAAGIKGNAAMVRLVLHRGGAVSASATSDALLRAASQGDEEIVNALLETGARHQDALTHAAQNDNDDDGVAITRALLRAGADPSVNKHECLWVAIRDDKPEVVRLLLTHPNIRLNNANLHIGRVVPLLFAITSHRPKIVGLLLDAGADINFETGTPIVLAVESGNPATVGLLVARGADPAVQNNRPLTDACHRYANYLIESAEIAWLHETLVRNMQDSMEVIGILLATNRTDLGPFLRGDLAERRGVLYDIMLEFPLAVASWFERLRIASLPEDQIYHMFSTAQWQKMKDLVRTLRPIHRRVPPEVSNHMTRFGYLRGSG